MYWFTRKLDLVFRGIFSCFIQIRNGNNEIPSLIIACNIDHEYVSTHHMDMNLIK